MSVRLFDGTGVDIANTHVWYVYIFDDSGKEFVSQKFTIPSTNTSPQISSLQDTSINEGGSYAANGSFTDPNSTSWTATVDYGDGSGSQPLTLSGMNFALNHQYKDEGTYTVIVSITNNQAATGASIATITVNNATPSVGTITGVSSTVKINTSITASANFTDQGVLDTHAAQWNWGDGNTTTGTVTESNGSGSVTNSHTYTALGAYTITLTVTDDDGGRGMSQIVVAIISSNGLAGRNLSGLNYSGADLSNQNIKGSNLQNATFNNTNFQIANLSGVNAPNASFLNANFTGAKLAGSTFQGANFTGANLTGANLKGANFKNAIMTGVTWSNTICPDGTTSNNDNNTCTGHGGGL